jgi:hyaluronan synthase
MLEVSFAYCFEFIRGSESMLGTVFCTPGALAAYRREALMKILNRWMSQTFFGRSANIGEDRAITNWILRTGWLVKFQCDAVVYTNVPTKYEGLCKMLLRWARSNVRENIMMQQFIWNKFRKSSMLGARVLYTLSWINMIVPNFLLAGLVFCILWRPDIFIMQVMLGSVLAACVPAAFYALRRRSSNALWAFAHNIFWVVALAWINPYSLLTMHKDSWLTRDLNTNEQTAISGSLERSAA